MATLIEEVGNSLKRMQDFDSGQLPREADLGRQMSFLAAVDPATKLIRLYKQLSLSSLGDFPDDKLGQIRNQADADYNRFQEILEFEASSNDAAGRREQLIQNIQNAYSPAFSILHPLIAFSVSSSADLQRMETDARATLQSIQDQAQSITKDMERQQTEAGQVLEKIREVAAEQGVSQQAVYFKEESDRHKTLAICWGIGTFVLALVLGYYAWRSLFIHTMIPELNPENGMQSAQLIAGKILIFSVIAYMMLLSARNFLASQHNAIINKHRQNALVTFRVLVDAAKDEDNSDIVLMQAASCIFTPQETGYARAGTGGGKQGMTTPVIELLRKAGSKVDGS